MLNFISSNLHYLVMAGGLCIVIYTFITRDKALDEYYQDTGKMGHLPHERDKDTLPFAFGMLMIIMPKIIISLVSIIIAFGIGFYFAVSNFLKDIPSDSGTWGLISVIIVVGFVCICGFTYEIYKKIKKKS